MKVRFLNNCRRHNLERLSRSFEFRLTRQGISRLWSDFGTASTQMPKFLRAKTNAKIIVTYFASSLTQ